MGTRVLEGLYIPLLIRYEFTISTLHYQCSVKVML
jgi:hypothetical protein